MTNGSLMKAESIAECSPWNILQNFWPALSDNWSVKPICGRFKSGRFTQVLKFIFAMPIELTQMLDSIYLCFDF